MKFSRGHFKMTRQGIELEAGLSPWLRFCVGVSIIMVAAAPLTYAIQWVRWW